MKQGTRTLSVLLACVGLGAGIAAGMGVFLRGEPATKTFVSLRGEAYAYRDTGVYRFNAERVVAEGIGWDLSTLGLAFPVYLLLWGAFLRGSFRTGNENRPEDIRIRLLLLGFLVYFFYQYLEYALYWAFGPLFPLHVFLFSVSAVGIVALAKDVKFDRLSESFDPSFPFKGVAILSWSVGTVLLLLWVPFVVGALRGNIEGKLYGSTTLVVQALDLGLVVPFAFWTADSAGKKRSEAYILSFLVGVKGVLMGTALCAMILSVWVTTGKLEGVPLGVFGTITLTSVYLLVRMCRSYKK